MALKNSKEDITDICFSFLEKLLKEEVGEVDVVLEGHLTKSQMKTENNCKSAGPSSCVCSSFRLNELGKHVATQNVFTYKQKYEHINSSPSQIRKE